jgi:sulfonate transport system substrate-binding protein
MNLSGVKISAFQVVDASYLKKNPKTVTNYLKAVKEGIDYIPTHKEQTAELAFKEIKLPKEGVLKDLETVNYVVGFSKEDFEHLQTMKTWLEEKGILKDKYELKDKIDVETLKAAFPETVTYTK